MKNIYILLLHTNTIPARIVKLFTRYKYSHVAISLEKDCNTIYSFGRRKVHSIIGGGLSVEKKDGEFFKYFNKTICEIYELEITNEQYNIIKENIKNMEENINNYKYDFLGTFFRYFGIHIRRKNKFVCSFFVGELLEKSGAYKFNKKTCMLKPIDFENLNNSKRIYSGLFKEYK